MHGVYLTGSFLGYSRESERGGRERERGGGGGGEKWMDAGKQNVI